MTEVFRVLSAFLVGSSGTDKSHPKISYLALFTVQINREDASQKMPSFSRASFYIIFLLNDNYS
jgi:hypothetical protein